MSETQEAVKVVLCESSPRFAIGLAKVLERSNVAQVVARCDNPRALMELVGKFAPQVVVLNADPPGSTGRTMPQPQPRA